MNSDFQISKATIQDIPQLEKLVNSAYRGETSKKGWTTEADFLDGIRIDKPALAKIINSPHSVILKCTNNNEVVGCEYLQKKQNELYIGMLTVSPDIQNKGIGKILLEAAEDYAKSWKIQLMSMTVITLRQELIEWYERRGFKKTAKIEPFPNDPRFGIPKQPLEFVVMEKTINDFDKT